MAKCTYPDCDCSEVGHCEREHEDIDEERKRDWNDTHPITEPPRD